MNLYWRITKIALLGVLIPVGVFAFGYLWLGPNMKMLPRLDPKGWQISVERLKPPEEQREEPVPVAAKSSRYNISVVSSKTKKRRRNRPDSVVLRPSTVEVKPSDAIAEVTPSEGTPEATLAGN